MTDLTTITLILINAGLVVFLIGAIFVAHKRERTGLPSMPPAPVRIPAPAPTPTPSRNIDAAAEIVLRGLRWRGAGNIESVIRYDKGAETIIVDEHGLMRLIMIANPTQRPRRLRLGDIREVKQ